MIWYLLYVVRGTTEPPSLHPDNPIRRAFTNYGRVAARHPVITLLISVAWASILIYPFPFLYTNDFANGSSNLPHHVWTAAQPYDGNIQTPPDVLMRSVWVHGSYMKALEPNVLQAALEIQDELLGPTIHFNPGRVLRDVRPFEVSMKLNPDTRDSFYASNGLTNQSWFFQSPLIYWSCSPHGIRKDKNILDTVNEGSTKLTAVNVTLRHSIVFSGKRFEGKRLVAADALVITLIHKIDSPVGHQWETQAEILANKKNSNWKLYPDDGRVTTSQLFQFKFQPLSFHDDLFLGVVHTISLVYFLRSLTRLKAVKSRFGLAVTVIVQLAFSIMSSFTVCAILNIDISKMPRETYPFVPLMAGLENTFRLVNAVIATPSGSSTSSRVATGLGQTGHIALASVSENLLLLWVLYKVVSPGVGAFCIFAAIALIFDFLYLFTFFAAVLSVDVRRTELSDSLNRAAQKGKGTDGNERHAWIEALIRGEVPVQTRLAGTMVMVGFVLGAQWHFFDNQNPMRTLSRILALVWADQNPPPSSASRLPIDVNQVRTPISWLLLQDHQTAREVINVIKPGAHSYVARVYDPLVFVVSGSNRTSSHDGIQTLLPALYEFAKHQSVQFIATVLFIVAAVSLLMNYLLWNEEEIGEDHGNDRVIEEPLLAVKTLSRGHALDIAMLAASPEGVVASVGLDRWIRLWDLRRETQSHIVNIRQDGPTLFPVLAISIDDSARWLAILSASGLASLWSIPERRWGPSINVGSKGRPPVRFFFAPNKTTFATSLIVIRSNGILSEYNLSNGETVELQELTICKSHILHAHQFVDKLLSSISLRIITTSRSGCVHITSQTACRWSSEAISVPLGENNEIISEVIAIPNLRSFLAVRQSSVDMLDLATGTTVHRFRGLDMELGTLRYFHTLRRLPQSDFKVLVSFSFAYTEKSTGACVLQTHVPGNGYELINVGSGTDSPNTFGCPWSESTVQVRKMNAPGDWEALPIGTVVGVRKRELTQILATEVNNATPTGLRKRIASAKARRKSVTKQEEDIWEAWSLSPNGDQVALSLFSEESKGNQLLASSCGPVTRVGQRSIAVGLGNLVKFITVGNERFDNQDEVAEESTLAIAGRRRKPLGSGKRMDREPPTPPHGYGVNGRILYRSFGDS